MIQPTPLWRSLRMVARTLFRVGFDAEIYGKQNIPEDGGAIIAANHQSYIDPPLVAAFLKRPVSFMAKSELFENRYFGWFIRNLHAFPIRQGRGDRGAIMESVKRLQEGALLNIYPEGSRCEDGEIAPLQPGIALVIRKAEVPVVPTVIDGSFDAWPRSRKLFRPHPLRVLYGPPMKLHDLAPAEIVSVLERTLRAMLADLRSHPAGAAFEPVTARVNPFELTGEAIRVSE